MRTCPDCYIELAMSNREGVQIDYCSTCRGVWLDHGELEKIIQLAVRAPYQSHGGHPQSHPQSHPQHHDSHQSSHNQYSQSQTSHHVHHDHHHHDHRKHDNYKHGHHGHYKKHKHEHPVADFLEDVFDIFG
jgi:uncharacterized protein